MTATQFVGPVVLFCLMFVIGLELTPADFKRVMASPRAVISGTIGQILLLPVMTWAVVWGLDINPVFGAGAILVAISPGAGASNIMVAIARGNIALSVTLTAMSSVLAVLTLPTIASFGMRVFLDDASTIDVPVASLMTQLLLSLLLPISLGMTLRTRFPQRATELAPLFHRITMGIIVLVIVGAIAFSDDSEIDYTGSGIAFVGAAVWTISAMGIGWGVARLVGLGPRDRFTFLIEFAARNIAVAAIVAMSGLGRLDLTLFGGIYAAVGYPLCAAAVYWHRRQNPVE